MNRVFCFLCALITFMAFLVSPVFAEEISEVSKQRLVDYKNAVESKDGGRIRDTWSALSKDHAAVTYMEAKAPDLADQYYQRRGIEAMNSVHQAQAKRGEIVPFADIENRPPSNPRSNQGPVPVSGDPVLADLADPSRTHVQGAPAGDPELAALVKKSQAVQARQQAPTKGGAPSIHDTTPAGGAVPKANTNFASGNSPTPGNTRASVPKPLTPPADHGPIPVSGDPALADLADPSRMHTQGAPKGDPELAALVQGKPAKTTAAAGSPPATPSEPYAAVPKKQPVFEAPGGGKSVSGQVRDGLSAGGNVVDGLQAAGQAASAIHKERQAAAEGGRDASVRNAAENIAGEALGQSAYDAGKANSKAAIEKAKKDGRPWWSALGDSLKKTGQDMSGYTGSKITNDEEALDELERAKAEGRAPNMGLTGAKGRAAVRTAGDASGMNSIFEAATYDPEADRAAADMERRLQQKVKDELQEALDETGMYERGMTRFKARENVSDPAIRARLRELQSEYAASRARGQAVNNRTRGKVNESDPQLISLRQAVDLLPENPTGIDMNEKIPPTKEELLAATDCSMYPHTFAYWSEERQAPICTCIDGFEWPSNGSFSNGCQPSRATQVANANCSHIVGAAAYWDNNAQAPMCGCPGGFVIVNNACVPAQQPQYQPVQQPPPFDPSALVNIFNQGAARQNPPSQGNVYTSWGNNSNQGGWTGGQLPGLGSSGGSSSSQSRSMGWVNQGYHVPSSGSSNNGSSNSPGVDTRNCGAGSNC